MQPGVCGDLWVERRHHDVSLTCQHGHVVVRGQHLDALVATTLGARMKTAWNGRARPTTSMSVSKLSTCRPYPLRRTLMSMTPKFR